MTSTRKAYLLLVLMLCAAAVALRIKPTHRLADDKPPVVLAKLIPSAFGEWKQIDTGAQQIINPQERKILSELYSQTLSKIYVNASGYRIMLSIAYGGDQSRDLGVHRPEVCYVAQGFALSKKEKVSLQIGNTEVPAMHLETHFGPRKEPVTYWIRVGEQVVRGNLELGLARLSYGVKGQIADGLLYRVSSIDADAQTAFKHQEAFSRDLALAMRAADRPALLGALGALTALGARPGA